MRRKTELEIAITRSGKSIQQIADEAGLDPRVLWMIRRRNYVDGPRDATLPKLAKALDLTEEALRALIMAPGSEIPGSSRSRRKSAI